MYFNIFFIRGQSSSRELLNDKQPNEIIDYKNL